MEEKKNRYRKANFFSTGLKNKDINSAQKVGFHLTRSKLIFDNKEQAEGIESPRIRRMSGA